MVSTRSTKRGRKKPLLVCVSLREEAQRRRELNQSMIELYCTNCTLQFCRPHLIERFNLVQDAAGRWPCPRCDRRLCRCYRCVEYYVRNGLDYEDEDDHDDDDGPDEEEPDKERDALVKELQDVKEERDCLFLRVQEFFAKLDDPVKKCFALEETCSFQRDQIAYLENQLKMSRMSSAEEIEKIAGLEDRLREAENQLVDGEKLREKLQTTILDLKGNTRVFGRVRPALPGDDPGASTSTYPTSSWC